MLKPILGIVGLTLAAFVLVRGSQAAAKGIIDEHDEEDEDEDEGEGEGLTVRQIQPAEMERNPALLAALTPFWEQTVNQAKSTGVAVTRHVEVAGKDFTLVASPSGRATVFEGRVG